MDLFFDLDGTLVDSARGIRESLRRGVEALGKDSPPDPVLDSMIGLTFREIWPKLTGASRQQDWDLATRAFRDHYDQGAWKQVAWMDGIQHALPLFRDAGHRLSVATMKPSLAAKKVLEFLGGAGWFELVLGAADAGENVIRGKGAVLQHALERGQFSRPAWLIGDRAEDIRAARECGLVSVAVAWGNGQRNELEAENPDYFCDSVAALRALILGAQVGR